MLVRSAVRLNRFGHNTRIIHRTRRNKLHFFQPSHDPTRMASASSYGEIPGTHGSPTGSHTNSMEMLTARDQHTRNQMAQETMTSDILSHSLSPSDPDNPMAWPMHRKLYVSLCGYLCAASV